MVTKPDAGDIVDQTAVPILPDDTAQEVFDKVSVAAELTLHRALPALIAGNAPRIPQDLRQGGYFSGRKPEDGRIDWHWSATRIHNLVRAVAPPYPGAFTTVAGQPARILRTRVLTPTTGPASPILEWVDGRLLGHCAGWYPGRFWRWRLRVKACIPAQLNECLGSGPWRLGE